MKQSSLGWSVTIDLSTTVLSFSVDRSSRPSPQKNRRIERNHRHGAARENASRMFDFNHRVQPDS